MTKDIFCPCPWTGMYVHLNKTLPCPFNKHQNDYSPLEYIRSDFVKDLKNSFELGEFHESCVVCKTREESGLMSGRKEFLKYHKQKTDNIQRLEVRFSNLCNFKCRMCEPNSSSEFLREMTGDSTKCVIEIDEYHIDEIKTIIPNVEYLTLTGGEPFLIKKYYELVDYLIDSEHSKHINLTIYTNGSVYNKKILNRLKQFKSVRLVVSIDGVGETAEYIRSGTDWKKVNDNVQMFLTFPFKIAIHITLQIYNMYDIYELCKYVMQLSEIKNDLEVKAYTIVNPRQLQIINIPLEHREGVIKQLNDGVKLLNNENTVSFKNELINIIKLLSDGEVGDYDSFVNYTEKYDSMRNENFQVIFASKHKKK